MSRTSPVGRFAPLAAVAVVQALLVLLVPSVGRAPAGEPGVAAGAPGTVAGVQPSGAPGAVASDAPGTVPGSTPVPGAGAAPGAAPGSGAAVRSGQSPAVAGSTAHCVEGRQFSPAVDYFAPPCVRGVPGAAFADNGGATSPGVTEDVIKVVQYVPDFGPAVNTILRAQGLYYDAEDTRVVASAYEKFINASYQLYGRKVVVEVFQGKCATVPPDLKCLIPEMGEMVEKHDPYAVVFSTTVCSACFAELARRRVVTTGGAGFSDELLNANAPYQYDVFMTATGLSLQFAELWCKQMTSRRGSGRTAVLAGTQNPSQDFRNRPRVLGVVSTNDPDNQRTVKEVLYPALRRGCGEEVTHEYFYAQDISTAQQQSQAGTAAMNDENPATSVLCMCDPVAPQFLYSAAAQNNYWPESLIATSQTMDFDSVGQTFVDRNGEATLACPTPARGCSFDNALGIGSSETQRAPEQMPGVRVFRRHAGGAALPVSPPIADIFWNNYNLLASLFQVTGPVLTPARMQAAAPQLGARGGGTTGYALRQFTPGGYGWTKDTRVVYFNKRATSPYNGAAGRYIQIEGRRMALGQFPTLRQPPAPPAESRR